MDRDPEAPEDYRRGSSPGTRRSRLPGTRRSRSPGTPTGAQIREELIAETRRQVKVEKN